LPILRTVLLDADISIVEDLAKALRDLHDPEAVALALKGLGEEPYTHRLAASITLGVLGDTRVAPRLRSVLDDPIAAVRQRGLEALTRLGADDESITTATTLLADQSPQVRVAAIRLLAAHHPKPGPVLARTIEDPNVTVRDEIARHLGKLAAADVRRLLADPDEGVRCRAARSAGSEHVHVLGELLAAEARAEVRRAAARALGTVRGQRAADALLAGIEDQDALVRSAALHALERALTRQGAIARLLDELSSERAQRRRFSLYALARLGEHDRATLVWRLADDPDLEVRLAVIETAAALLSDPEPLLMYMSTDPNQEVRASAQHRLAGQRPQL
jgi:HEAT repeat protein